MAVATSTGTGRRSLLLATAAALPALCGRGSPATAQGTAGPPPFDAGRFLGFAYSSAVLQERASTLAATRDTRPEVKAFAGDMARFRGTQLDRLRAVAQERGLQPPAKEAFEHRVVLENLEPLDYLALSRRYAEVQVQALEQEIQSYETAEHGADEGMKRFAGEILPQLQQRLGAARRMLQAVRS